MSADYEVCIRRIEPFSPDWDNPQPVKRLTLADVCKMYPSPPHDWQWEASIPIGRMDAESRRRLAYEIMRIEFPHRPLSHEAVAAMEAG